MKKIHYIGIGGIGMSALALLDVAEGNAVTGSDTRPNNLTDELARLGAGIYRGHSPENVRADRDLVVRSTCIRDDNPEILRAKELGLDIISRGQMLRGRMRAAGVSVGVTGTHGKTTTSALIAHITEKCGKDPTVVVGGEMELFRSNAKSGRGGLLVAEVDESDGYFRNISCTAAVVTNVEREHMEHYGSFDDLIAAYGEFMEKISPDGFLVASGEDRLAVSLAARSPARKIFFGIGGDLDVTCRDFSYSRSIEFTLVAGGRERGRFSSPLVGRYNIMNILGAVAACLELGLDLGGITEAVRSFRGVKRRFDLVGRVGGIEVIEDYAHHPTELKSVIRAAREYGSGRVVTIFQPHRYSRTRDLMKEFSESFYDSDVLILTDIYSADEDVIGNVDIQDMKKAIDGSRLKMVDVIKKEAIPEFVSGIIKDDDTVLVLGAGDIREIAGSIVDKIKEKRTWAVDAG